MFLQFVSSDAFLILYRTPCRKIQLQAGPLPATDVQPNYSHVYSIVSFQEAVRLLNCSFSHNKLYLNLFNDFRLIGCY